MLSIIALFASPSIKTFEQNNISKNDKNWKNFLDINMSEMINNNQLIFLDITADWCATCQFNKLNVLESKKIKSIFKKNNILLVRADWTKPNKKIDNYLKKYNKFGIPFNAFFSLKYPNGIILSELLTEQEIMESIELIK
tara:strand:+ start:252 stop:671 length:420 start_codon:yes stop_codon:yes gene_type:complete